MTSSTQSKGTPLVTPDQLKSWVIYEDEGIIVVNKPGWLVCHPSKCGPWSSLVSATRELLQLETIFLAGRLDRETSGVILMAKDQPNGRKWQKALEQKLVKRTYLTILEGELKEKTDVNGFIGNDPDSAVFVKQRVTVNTRKSKKSSTSFIPLVSRAGYTLASVVTKTGRKHQIRLHAQSAGFPLVGEKLYGHYESYYLKFCESGWNPSWIEQLGMDRQALHARRFGFFGEGSLFEAEIPADFLNFLTVKMKVKDEELSVMLKNANQMEAVQMDIDLGCKNSLID